MEDDELRRLFEAIRQETSAIRQELKQETAAIRQELQQETAAVRQDLRQETAAIRQELRQETAAIRQETAVIRQETAAIRQELGHETGALRQEIAAVRQENAVVRQENAAAHVETRRHFDVALEATNHELRLVAEGLSVTREELARTATDLSDRIDRVAAEAQAMIRFSHSELERRMRNMEET